MRNIVGWLRTFNTYECDEAADEIERLQAMLPQNKSDAKIEAKAALQRMMNTIPSRAGQ